ncbi:DUF4176 domain-containing protein [Lactococcus lactis]|uniref:DUF4176 domain-containing protein n=1 Tax=Lactococcus lactis TaxID=1358 RepID=UPI0011238CB6|nr:DUF4176 domain-containing protein [Lactococcus lactis]TNU81190.1 DUF4176 domain-containing protein [Lactococcus lactis subsp. lactis]
MNHEEQKLSYLPLGTVVLLERGEKRLIIIGRKQISVETEKEFDYAGVLFPEGYQSSENLYLFNHSDVENIFQMGLIDSEELSYQTFLSE